MSRRTSALLVVGALALVGPVAVPQYAAATTVDDQRREVERIVDELERLEEQADILAEDYVVAIDEKNQLDAEVAEAQARVAAKEAEVERLRGELSAVAVRAFTSSGTDVLGPLFTDAGTYNDELAANQYSRVALAVGTATTDDLDEVVADLQDERAALDAKLAQAQALTEQIAEAQQATDERKAEYQQRRAEAEAELGQLIAEEEQRRIAEAQRAMEARVAAAANRPAAPASGGGGGGGGGGESTGGDTGSSSDDSGGGAAAPAPAPTYPAPSSLAQVAINAAMSQIGVPYQYATSIPGVGFDCSGLTAYAWGQAGVGLPHQSRAQAGSLPQVPIEAAQPGDLIFYYSPISHVGIYLGGGQLVHAPNTGKTVTVASVNWSKVVVVARPG